MASGGDGMGEAIGFDWTPCAQRPAPTGTHQAGIKGIRTMADQSRTASPMSQGPEALTG
jgi:hypothetical protein